MNFDCEHPNNVTWYNTLALAPPHGLHQGLWWDP